eukprot:7444423-Lingulodinium_polyedra.AAC.1
MCIRDRFWPPDAVAAGVPPLFSQRRAAGRPCSACPPACLDLCQRAQRRAPPPRSPRGFGPS